jgi:hypothetical protein
VTDEALQGTKSKKGIPNNFVHVETIQAGNPTLHMTTVA